jgi:transcription elongation factor Elf1
MSKIKFKCPGCGHDLVVRSGVEIHSMDDIEEPSVATVTEPFTRMISLVSRENMPRISSGTCSGSTSSNAEIFFQSCWYLR